jgi:hypothetical protein
VRLAISALPGFGIVTAVATVTGALALWPHPAPAGEPAARVFSRSPISCPIAPAPTCEHAHRLVVRGRVSGGVSHVQLAGPIIYTDVTTQPDGRIELWLPVDGDVCSLLREPASYSFSDGSMQLSYTIGFAR